MTCKSCGAEIPEGSRFCNLCGLSPDGTCSDPLLGQVLCGKYKVQALLGAGGMGRVYLATDTLLKRPVALKFPPDPLQFDPAAIESLRHSVELVLDLRHEHIVAVYGFEHDAKFHRYFVPMEYVPGGDLAQRLGKGGPLTRTEIEALVSDLGEALAYAHRKRLIHRDVKPANILLTGDGHFRLADFGIAARVKDEMQRTTGNTVFSLAYASPQMLDGVAPSAADDVWGFGCVILEALTGRPAFEASNPAALMKRVMDGRFEIPSTVDPALRDRLLNWLSRDAGTRSLSPVPPVVPPPPPIRHEPAPAPEPPREPLLDKKPGEAPPPPDTPRDVPVPPPEPALEKPSAEVRPVLPAEVSPDSSTVAAPPAPPDVAENLESLLDRGFASPDDEHRHLRTLALGLLGLVPLWAAPYLEGLWRWNQYLAANPKSAFDFPNGMYYGTPDWLPLVAQSAFIALTAAGLIAAFQVLRSPRGGRNRWLALSAYLAAIITAFSGGPGGQFASSTWVGLSIALTTTAALLLLFSLRPADRARFLGAPLDSREGPESLTPRRRTWLSWAPAAGSILGALCINALLPVLTDDALPGYPHVRRAYFGVALAICFWPILRWGWSLWTQARRKELPRSHRIRLRVATGLVALGVIALHTGANDAWGGAVGALLMVLASGLVAWPPKTSPRPIDASATPNNAPC